MAEEKFELNEQQLDQASGGEHVISGIRESDIRNRKNQLVGYYHNKKQGILYVPCDKCGRPMHDGDFGWYCDPCDRHLFDVDYYEWQGTANELRDASL